MGKASALKWFRRRSSRPLEGREEFQNEVRVLEIQGGG